MKKLGSVIGLFLVVALAVLILGGKFAIKPAEYHLREFESLKTNFNNYQPSLSDRLRGIMNKQAKWDYHLRKLQELGVVTHTNFVFTSVPYTQESSTRIFRQAHLDFPTAVLFSARYYATNDPRYGVQPLVLEVWDFPTNFQRWASFVQAHDH